MSNIISLLNFLKQFLAELIRCIRSTLADTNFFISTVGPLRVKEQRYKRNMKQTIDRLFTPTSDISDLISHITYWALVKFYCL